MQDESALYLGRSQPVTGDVHHIVNAAGNPVISVLVAPRAIASEVHALEGREVGLNEALVISIDCSHLPRPAVEDDEIAFCGAVEDFAFAVHDRRLDPEKWQGCRAR